MYRVAKNNGESVAVPQLLFARLTFPDAGEVRFKVALYVVANRECEPKQVAEALHARLAEVEKALEYWEGAGLLERVAEPGGEALPQAKVPRRTHMNTAEVNRAAGTDPVLGAMMQELQRIFGGIVSQRDQGIFCTLYCEDGFPADLILTAALYCHSEGKAGALRVERTLFDWQKQGIDDCAGADRLLQRLNAREGRYTEVAALMKLSAAGFTAAECRQIDRWSEEYGYGNEMIEAARLEAGDKQNNIKYIGAILKRWHAKGHTNTRDVHRSEQGHNIRVQGGAGPKAPEDDLLANRGYVPMPKKAKRGTGK